MGKLINVLKDISYQYLIDYDTSGFSDEKFISISSSLLASILNNTNDADLSDTEMPVTFLGCTLNWSSGSSNDRIVTITKNSLSHKYDLSTLSILPSTIEYGLSFKIGDTLYNINKGPTSLTRPSKVVETRDPIPMICAQGLKYTAYIFGTASDLNSVVPPFAVINLNSINVGTYTINNNNNNYMFYQIDNNSSYEISPDNNAIITLNITQSGNAGDTLVGNFSGSFYCNNTVYNVTDGKLTLIIESEILAS